MKQEITLKFPKRGVFRYGQFHVRSGYPFILFSKKITLPVSGELTVYPRLVEVGHLLSAAMAGRDDAPLRSLGAGDELYSIREHRPGDEWRKVHWKLSAKTSRLLVKEFADMDFLKVTVILDNLLPPSGEVFERAVSAAGSLCRHFLEAGYLVRGVSCRKVVPFGMGEEQLYRILGILAVIREEEAVECPSLSDKEGIVVVVLKTRDSSLRRLIDPESIVVHADTL